MKETSTAGTQMGWPSASISAAAELRAYKARSAHGWTRFRIAKLLERARRFERPTLTLARLCSTPELRPLYETARRRSLECYTQSLQRCKPLILDVQEWCEWKLVILENALLKAGRPLDARKRVINRILQVRKCHFRPSLRKGPENSTSQIGFVRPSFPQSTLQKACGYGWITAGCCVFCVYGLINRRCAG